MNPNGQPWFETDEAFERLAAKADRLKAGGFNLMMENKAVSVETINQFAIHNTATKASLVEPMRRGNR